MEDVAAGHAFVIHGGEAEAHERWRDRVVAGKLGVVQLPGKSRDFKLVRVRSDEQDYSCFVLHGV